MKVSELIRVLAPVVIEVFERFEAGFEADEAAGQRGWTSQADSPIPPRLHVNCARRLVAAGDNSNAAHVGRKYLLSPNAVATELARLSNRPARKAKAAANIAPVSMAARLDAAARRGAR